MAVETPHPNRTRDHLCLHMLSCPHVGASVHAKRKNGQTYRRLETEVAR